MSVQDRYKDFLADQREYYDELITEDWETYLIEDLFRLWRFEVARLFSRVRPATILNLGCGCGYHDCLMAEYPFVKRIDAVDYSPRSIEKAEKHYPHPKVRRRVADFLTLRPEEPYDLVVSYQVIEHLEDPEAFMRLKADCCRPGGSVAVFTVNRMRPYNRVQARYGKPPVMEDPMHKQEFTADELRALGSRAGLIPRSTFSYALSKPWKLFTLSLWAAYFFPSRGTRLGAVFQKPDEAR